jgi:SAM-dependent methyltransferase
MYLVTKIKNILRALKQKWGTFEIKHKLWDKEYGGGRWDHCEHTPGALVYDYIEKYSINGSILDLGCGSGNTANELGADKYHDYTGVDISEVAIKKAAARCQANNRGQKNRFVQGDIISCVPKQKHDVILFRESIYYVPHFKIKGMLDRYAPYLSEKGVFVVNVGQNGTHKARMILDLIERNYRIVEKYAPAESDEFVVVFR